MEKNKFELIFKSALPPELASVDKEKTKDTIYSNLFTQIVSKNSNVVQI